MDLLDGVLPPQLLSAKIFGANKKKEKMMKNRQQSALDIYIKAVDQAVFEKPKQQKVNFVEKIPGQTHPVFIVVGKNGKKYVAKACSKKAYRLHSSCFTFYEVETGMCISGWWKKRKLGIVKRLQNHLNKLENEFITEIIEKRKNELRDYCKAVDVVTRLEKENER